MAKEDDVMGIIPGILLALFTCVVSIPVVISLRHLAIKKHGLSYVIQNGLSLAVFYSIMVVILGIGVVILWDNFR